MTGQRRRSHLRAATRAASLLVAASLCCVPALAGNDCSSSVSSAQDSGRQTFINGMAGLASNNFSNRPASFSSMACLDKFMQGNMDIMFKPPSLNDLLGQVMNFACQAATTSSTSGSMPNISSLIGSLSGGLNMGGSSGSTGGITNLAGMMSSLFGGGTTSSSTSGSSSGGLSSLFTNTPSYYGSGSSGSFTGTGTTSGTGTITYPDGSTGSPTNTPAGGNFQSQGQNPGLDSKLLQGHALTLPNGF